MPNLSLYQVDSFTRRALSGNPAGVVIGGDELRDDQMQAIARELNNSETAFILRPDGDDHALRIRFFTPTTEVPSCGHATLAAHYVRARILGLTPGRVWHKIKAGRLAADIEMRDDDYFVVIQQTEPEIGKPYSPDLRSDILRALNLEAHEVVDELPIQRINTGNPKIMVPVRSREILNRLAPDMNALIALHQKIPNGGCFVFTLADPEPGVLSHARMFAPNIGIAEDPVTGNGNGPLGAYLVHNGLAPSEGEFHFLGRQGEAIGRAGDVHVWVVAEKGVPKQVRIGGHATIVFEAQLSL